MRIFAPLDALLLAGLMAGGGWLIWHSVGPEGAEALVYVDGLKTARLDLDGRVRQFAVRGRTGTVVLEVGPPGVRVARSPCREGVCKRRGWLKRTGEVAVCVPEHLVLRVGGAGPRLDGQAF